MAEHLDVFLDVDGVLNTGTVDLPVDNGYSPRTRLVEGLPYSLDLVDDLNALAARPGVRMHWLTTWLRRAPEFLCERIGLNGQEWPVIGVDEHTSSEAKVWWKWVALANLRPSEPFVWLDDDLAYGMRVEPDVDRWVKARPKMLGITPRSETGLTRDHLTLVRGFVEGALGTDGMCPRCGHLLGDCEWHPVSGECENTPAPAEWPIIFDHADGRVRVMPEDPLRVHHIFKRGSKDEFYCGATPQTGMLALWDPDPRASIPPCLTCLKGWHDG